MTDDEKMMKSCRWIKTLDPHNSTWLRALNLSAMLNDAEKYASQPDPQSVQYWTRI